MKSFLTKNWFIIAFIFLGITGGFLYWRFIGCSGGSCPITSNWHASSIMGGIMGFLTGSTVQDFRTKKQNEAK